MNVVAVNFKQIAIQNQKVCALTRLGLLYNPRAMISMRQSPGRDF
jgi:hypothetical protein